MGEIKAVEPVKLFCGFLYADDARRLEARRRLEAAFGAVDAESDVISFTFTDYYQPEMGAGLLRRFVSFAAPVDPGRLAEIKVRTNAIEAELAERSAGAMRRTVNLDPGYLTASQLVLATTKNYAHRIYIGQGIYAEVTLRFRKNGCEYFDWTYPDYRTEAYAAFFLGVRRRFMAAG